MINKQYVAGFFDGEGSVTVQLVRPTSAGPFYTMKVQMTQVQVGPLREIKRRWGGSLRLWKRREETLRKHNWRDVWCWRLGGKGAQRFLTDLLPFLTIKSRQAKIAIKFYARMKKRGWNGRNPLSTKEREVRMRMINRLRSMNIKGRTEHLR